MNRPGILDRLARAVRLRARRPAPAGRPDLGRAGVEALLSRLCDHARRGIHEDHADVPPPMKVVAPEPLPRRRPGEVVTAGDRAHRHAV